MRNIKEALKELQEKMGYFYQDEDLLKQALTHSSFANEQKINKLRDYERLEFLGDAVLELVTSEFLYMKNENLLEGELTRMRASMVCEPALAYCARDIGLGNYVMLGKGEEATGGRKRDYITSDVLEAVIGSIYLDGGLESAKKFIYQFVMSDLEHKILFLDSKTLLQEEVQKQNNAQLHYELVGEHGPDHNKEFFVNVYLNNALIGSGSGKTKKSAEQQAAYNALIKQKGMDMS